MKERRPCEQSVGISLIRNKKRNEVQRFFTKNLKIEDISIDYYENLTNQSVKSTQFNTRKLDIPKILKLIRTLNITFHK